MFLGEAIASVQAQTLLDWELLVVDDASDDGTIEWLAGLRDTRIKAFRIEQHSERSAARNLGLARVRTEFVLFLDDDDRLRPWALRKLVAPLTRRPDAIAGVGARVLVDGEGRRQRHPHPWIGFTQSVWPDVLLGWIPAPGQWMFRTPVIRACGGFSESFVPLEDYELWLKVVQLGPTVVIPWSVLEYRLHLGQSAAPDPELVLEAIRHDAVNSMRAKQRETATRILQARASLVMAHRSYLDGRFGRAVQLYFAAGRLAPAALWSPITGPPILRQIFKSVVGLLLGPRVAGAIGRLRSVLRDVRDRRPEVVRDIKGGPPT